MSIQRSKKNELRIVLDTNILISALGWDGIERQVTIQLLSNNQLYISPELLSELSRVLFRKKFLFLDEKMKRTFIDQVTKLSHRVSPTARVRASRDKDDNIVLECAIAAHATHIVSGDKDLLILKEYDGIAIVSAKEFLNILKY